MTRTVSLLHVSDLHFSRRTIDDSKVVIASFLQSVQSRQSMGENPDIIVFSGDLANDADETEIYQLLFDEVIAPLVGLTSARLVTLPGNHDAQRSAIRPRMNRDLSIIHEVKSRKQLNEYCRSEDFTNLVAPRFAQFTDLQRCIDASELIFENAISRVYHFSDLDVAVMTLNTAAFTLAGIDGHSDYGSLLVPEALVVEAIDHLPDDCYRIISAHHPSEWLEEICRKDLEMLIAKTFDLHLFGHVHEARPSMIVDPAGSVYRNQSGALYSNRNRFNGYTLISVITAQKHLRAEIHSYFDGRREFDVATNVCPGGTVYSSNVAQSAFSEVITRKVLSQLAAWLENVMVPHLRHILDDGFAKRPVSEVFVEPPLTRGPRRAVDADDLDGPDPRGSLT
ncbi:MAG: hypothetical protein HC883_03905 [Bdellovibrionaceae bacterium]|nr:hypothetical protein [Pseudobdellovibrionaceae bacterium]